MSFLPRRVIFFLLCTAFCASGCATVPYKYGQNFDTPLTLELRPQEVQMERGRPVPWVDGLGHYFFSLPSKLILWNWQVDNHKIDVETEGLLARYLELNDLPNVKVRINQYAPGGEWRRLFRNREMPAFFRYTLGLLSTAYYTILPGRLFGGDNYNPYTNTINIYSDVPAVVLHEGAHAKDYAGKRNRHWKGWYSFLRILPLTPLYQEAVASNDAISFAVEEKLYAEEEQAYKVLYPAYMTYISGEGLRWVSIDFWIQYAAQAALALPGHVVGRIRAAGVEYPEDEPLPALSSEVAE